MTMTPAVPDAVAAQTAELRQRLFISNCCFLLSEQAFFCPRATSKCALNHHCTSDFNRKSHCPNTRPTMYNSSWRLTYTRKRWVCHCAICILFHLPNNKKYYFYIHFPGQIYSERNFQNRSTTMIMLGN